MRNGLTAAAVVMALALPAWAQDAATTTSPATTTTPATSAPATSSWYSGKRAQEIVGQDLYGADGEEIGSINNVLLSSDGTQAAALVGVGGFLGIGEREVAIPLDEVSMDADDRLTTTLTRDAIGELAPFEEGGDWNPFNGDGTLG
jgi:sporulation protein YlmC with PRC-barrel domain